MHCLPGTLLDGKIPAYDDFLEQRRQLMALKIKQMVRGAVMMKSDLKPTDAVLNFNVMREWGVRRLAEITTVRSERNQPTLPLLSIFLNRGVTAYQGGGG